MSRGQHLEAYPFNEKKRGTREKRGERSVAGAGRVVDGDLEEAGRGGNSPDYQGVGEDSQGR